MMRGATSSLIFQARHRAAQRVSDIQVLHRLSSGFSFQERWKLVLTVYALRWIRPIPKWTLRKWAFYLNASRQQGAADMLTSVWYLGVLLGNKVNVNLIISRLEYQIPVSFRPSGTGPVSLCTAHAYLTGLGSPNVTCSSRGGRDAARSRQLT